MRFSSGEYTMCPRRTAASAASTIPFLTSSRTNDEAVHLPRSTDEIVATLV